MLPTFSLIQIVKNRSSFQRVTKSFCRSSSFSTSSPPQPTSMFLLTYKYDARDETELAVRRASIRPFHLEHAMKAQKAGKLFLGGASLPVISSNGNGNGNKEDITGVLVFRNCSLEEVEEFAANDPYVVKAASHGKPLAKSFTIRTWNVVIKPESIN